MNLKIVVTATAFAGTLALVAPALAQNNQPAGQTTVPKHHHGAHRAGRGSTSDIDAHERQITRQLNQDQLGAPRPPGIR